MHEPVFVTSSASHLQGSFQDSYLRLAAAATHALQLHLVTYYDDVDEDVYRWAVQLPVAGIHLDFLGVGAGFSGWSW